MVRPLVWTSAILLAGLATASVGPAVQAPSAVFLAHTTRPSASEASPRPFMDGVIEGFYGPDWTVANTEAVFKFMDRTHLNTFVYAPKYDPYQRADWMIPYPPKQYQVLSTLVRSAKSEHITFVYSVSPGLSIHYQNPQDRKQLLAKIDQVQRLGVSHFMLSFDDIGGELTAALATKQAQLADFIVHRERIQHPRFTLIFTPTLYDGIRPSPYWAALKTFLYQGISVVWTGPYVLSKTISSQDEETAQRLIGHRLVIWDNYPVNDYTYLEPPYHPHLFLGPVTGRSPGLKARVAGYFFNPMLQAQASEVALYTGASYLNHPLSYHPQSAWLHALAFFGGKAKASFSLFASANSSSFLAPSLNSLSVQIKNFWATRPLHPNHSALEKTFAAMANANANMQAGLPYPVFYQQISPWSRLFSEEGRAGMEAIALLTAAKSGKRPNPNQIHVLTQLQSSIVSSKLSLDTTPSVEQFIGTVLGRFS